MEVSRFFFFFQGPEELDAVDKSLPLLHGRVQLRKKHSPWAAVIMRKRPLPKRKSEMISTVLKALSL